MNLANTQTLLAAHPQLLRSLREFGFECDDGWFDLLTRLFMCIDAQVRMEGVASLSENWPEIVVVKQKFGTLRVSFGNGAMLDTSGKDVSSAIRQLIETASEQSATICEQCGAPARSVQTHPKRPWLKTLCLVCHPD